MVSATISRSQQQQLVKALKGTNRKIGKELSIAVNKTAKKTKTAVSKQVRQELAANAKAVNKVVDVKKKASSTEKQPSSIVVLSETDRLPLKAFKPRQTKKGVSYKISKSQGRSTAPGAFMGPKPGVLKPSWEGNVFKREGKGRTPIYKPRGPSPWGVFLKQKMRKPVVVESQAELKKQIERRIRFIELKKSGDI